MRSTLTRPLSAMLVVVALLAAACGGSSKEPASELADAIKALGETSFAYALTLDLDGAAANELLGPDMGMAAGFVNSLAITGAVDDGAFSLGAGLMGFEPFSLRSYDGGEELYVRVGLAEIAQSFGADLSQMGLSPEAFAGMPGDAGELFSRLLGGEWVGFVGLDAGELGDDQADAAAELGVDVQQLQQLGEDLRARLSDIDELLADLAVVTRTETDGKVTFGIAIRTEEGLREVQQLLRPIMAAVGEEQTEAEIEAEIAQAMQTAPASIPGLSATVTDGDLTEIALDVGLLLGAFNATEQAANAGDFVLRLGFSEHGSAQVEDKPADAVTYDQAQLEELSGMLSDPSLLLGDSLGPDTSDFASAEQQASLLVALQMSYFEANGAYTDDIEALLAFDQSMSSLITADAAIGACTIDDGQGFVVGAQVDGEVTYFDSDFATYTDTTGLLCEPTLTTRS